MKKAASYYHVSRISVWRWAKRYDGTDGSLADKSHRPKTPEHNGKVERSHRVDQERFYRTLSFSSLDGLREQGKRWNGRYNNLPKMILKLKSPNEVELESLRRIKDNAGEVRCPKLLKRFTSADN